MIRFFTKLFRRIAIRSANDYREIFRYWDGSRERSIDPLVAFRRLDTHSVFDWESHPILIDQRESAEEMMREEGWKALEITVNAVHEVFDTKPYDERDESGLPDAEAVGLLISFSDYLVSVKKNISGGPISPQTTAPKSSEKSTTKPESGFSSTGEGKPQDEQSPSQTEFQPSFQSS